jgi:hypothetical protein
VQYIQALGPTVVAVVAAGIAGYIAWRQWRTAHDKLSFDLFECPPSTLRHAYYLTDEEGKEEITALCQRYLNFLEKMVKDFCEDDMRT